jgi:hypothetical protein
MLFDSESYSTLPISFIHLQPPLTISSIEVDRLLMRFTPFVQATARCDYIHNIPQKL